jgi:hypothetical protein
MTTTLNEQFVSAYHDSVIKASGVAVACWDNHKPAQDGVLSAPGVVASILAGVNHANLEKPENRQFWTGLCLRMLTGMSSLLRLVKELNEHSFAVDGLDEFRGAMTDLRHALANIVEAGEGTPGSAAETPDAKATEDFSVLAKELPPPQSWYDEDFSGARGPMTK